MTDARRVLQGLVGKTITTWSGRPNSVLAIEGDKVRVGTTRSPRGTLVPIRWVQDGLDMLEADGEVPIDVPTLGHRSAFVGAVLLSRAKVERGSSPSARRVP